VKAERTTGPDGTPAATDREGRRSGSALLKLERVVAGYGTTAVLQGVTLEVRPGEVVALLGPNGAGKTTVLRAATGIVHLTSGSVSIAGIDVRTEAPHRRANRGLCLIPEGRGVFKSLSVRENLRLQVPPGEPRPDEAIDGALAVFPALESRMKQLAGHLSGGQQQMLSLARAYVTKPKVILVDEVSMGLAPLVVDEMFAALRNLAASGVAMLIVEQYVSRAMAMADTVVLLSKGTVTYDGPPSGLDEHAVLQGYLGVDGSE
jgi:branched-chain amino acid transport system ATP-binding protein